MHRRAFSAALAASAGLASVVSYTNLSVGLGDPDADIVFLVDLRTGIPTPADDILPVPATKGASASSGLALDGAPAISTDRDRTLITYALSDREAIEIWQHDLAGEESVHLGILPPPAKTGRPNSFMPSIDVAANGAVFVISWTGTWISTTM